MSTNMVQGYLQPIYFHLSLTVGYKDIILDLKICNTTTVYVN